MPTKISTLATIIALTGLAVADDPKPEKTADPKAAPGAMMPPELAAMGNAMAGTWNCKGQGLSPEHRKLVEMTATSKWSVEMGGWWVHESFAARMGKASHVFEAYTTFDPGLKKWKRVMVQGGGGWNTGEATSVTECGAAPNGCKMDWELSVHNMMGEFPFKDHFDATDLKAGFKGWGELSMDKGKTWTKAYEMTCKK
jgi:hypothetical protein